MPTFNVFNLKSSTLVCDANGVALSFDSGKAAADFVAAYKLDNPGRYQPRIAQDSTDLNWREREQGRMDSAEYVPVIWSDETWWSVAANHDSDDDYYRNRYPEFASVIGIARDHFAHGSMKDKSKMAYTESAEKGALDRQTAIKPGAYLAKYFASVLNCDQIAYFARQWQEQFADANLCFARTPEEIQTVYQDGPRSCMSYGVNDYDTYGIHPVTVYGKPHSDITLAYVRNGGSISARCLVWEDKKRHSRIYGDDTLIARELKALGYSKQTLIGAKIAKIETDNGGYVMPYLDDADGVDACGDHFIIRNDAEYQARETNGLCEQGSRYTCDSCDARVDEDDIRGGPHGEGSYCESCYYERYSCCEHCGEDSDADTCSEVRTSRSTSIMSRWNTQCWCESCVENNSFYCEATGAQYRDDQGVELADGETISQEAYENGGYFTCDETNEIYSCDDAIEMADGRTVCKSWFDDNGFECDETGNKYDDSDKVGTADGRTVCREWFDDNSDDDDNATSDDDDNATSDDDASEDDASDARQLELPLESSGIIRVSERTLDGYPSGHWFAWFYANSEWYPVRNWSNAAITYVSEDAAQRSAHFARGQFLQSMRAIAA